MWLTDELLARRVVAGDRRACATFVQRFHARIYRLLVRLSHDAGLAEDLTQETFASAWANIATFAGGSSLSTWLHRIAYRKWVDWRRRAREVGVVIDCNADQVAGASVEPCEHAIRCEESNRLHLALGQLPSRQRDVLVLHYMQGLSYREIAQVLAEPCGTVKWRTSRALDELREILEGQQNAQKRIIDTVARVHAIHCLPFAPIAGPARA
jgi:RNA polymerase sigma-70 factor, ECF subfamily